jgi:hypothetical protein
MHCSMYTEEARKKRCGAAAGPAAGADGRRGVGTSAPTRCLGRSERDSLASKQYPTMALHAWPAHLISRTMFQDP